MFPREGYSIFLRKALESALFLYYDVDDARGTVLQDELTAHHLLIRIGAKAVDARQVGHQCVGVAFYHTVLAVNRYSGEVTHMLVAARQLVEKRGFTAILISHKGKGQFLCLGRAVRLRRVVISGAILSQTGVFNGTLSIFFLNNGTSLCERRVGVYLYFLCIRQSKR